MEYRSMASSIITFTSANAIFPVLNEFFDFLLYLLLFLQ